jgi:hypothetical protein
MPVEDSLHAAPTRATAAIPAEKKRKVRIGLLLFGGETVKPLESQEQTPSEGGC